MLPLVEANSNLMEPSPCLSMAHLPLQPQLSSRSDSVHELTRRGSLHLEIPLQQLDQGLQAQPGPALVHLQLILTDQSLTWTEHSYQGRRTYCYHSARSQSASELKSNSTEQHLKLELKASAPLQLSDESEHQV